MFLLFYFFFLVWWYEEAVMKFIFHSKMSTKNHCHKIIVSYAIVRITTTEGQEAKPSQLTPLQFNISLIKMSLENKTRLKYDFTELLIYLVGVCLLSGLNSCYFRYQWFEAQTRQRVNSTLYRIGGVLASWPVHLSPD